MWSRSTPLRILSSAGRGPTLAQFRLELRKRSHRFGETLRQRLYGDWRFSSNDALPAAVPYAGIGADYKP
jgi:hypothetical protein